MQCSSGGENSSDKLVKTGKSTFQKYRRSAALTAERVESAPVRCSYCHSPYIESFASVYGHGTSTARHTRGLLIQTGWSRTQWQSELAKQCAPPRKRRYWLATFLLILMASGVAAGEMIPQFMPDNTLSSSAVIGLLGFALALRSFWWNWQKWPLLMESWSRNFFCRRCGTVTRI